MSQDFQTPTYPVVGLAVRYGKPASLVLSVVVAAAAVVAAVHMHLWWLAPVGVVAAAVLMVLLLSYVEVLRIISDTLLPRY